VEEKRLDAGAHLGPYGIVTPIGSGGMADVYRGRDTRLDRTVPIKVLRGEFTERFEREARAISALNHPNICTLYDAGREDHAGSPGSGTGGRKAGEAGNARALRRV